jgi:hypothetical protein
MVFEPSFVSLEDLEEGHGSSLSGQNKSKGIGYFEL